MELKESVNQSGAKILNTFKKKVAEVKVQCTLSFIISDVEQQTLCIKFESLL